MLRSGFFITALGLALAAAQAQQEAAPAAQEQSAPAATQQPAAAPAGATTPQAGEGHRPTKKERDEAQKLFVQGAKDIDHNKIRAAMDCFVRAAELNPEEPKYAYADQIARQHLVTDLIQQSDKDKILGHFGDAREKIAEAYGIDPASPVVAQHMDELASAVVAGEPAVRSRPACEAFIFAGASAT